MKEINLFKDYAVKNLTLSVKDIDTVGRRVKVMLSHFGNVDADGDMIMKGAFAKSILERGHEAQSNRKIAFLRNHDWDTQIGKWVKLEETEEGLIGIGEMGRSTKGNDAFLDYQDGILNEHSIGFQRVRDKIEYVGLGEESYQVLKEVVLWEGSAVTFGANSLTPVLEVSKGQHITHIERLNNEMEKFINALKNGKGSDERLYSIEMGLKVLKQKYSDFFAMYPPIVGSKEVTSSDVVTSENDDLKRVDHTNSNKQLLTNLILKK